MATNKTANEARNAWGRKEMASAYDQSFQTVIGRYINRSEIDAVLGLMQTRKDTLVLDAGCGTGRYLQELPSNVVKVGLDYSAAMIEIARHNDFTTRLAVGTLESMPFKDEVFDEVICSRVTQHMLDQQGAISELARVTKPGGHVIVLSYNTWTFHCLYKNMRQRGVTRPINVALQLFLKSFSFGLSKIHVSRLAKAMDFAAAHSPFAAWNWKYDNYISLPELKRMFVRAGLRPTLSSGATAGDPWILSHFGIDFLLGKSFPMLLSGYCKLCATFERRMKSKPIFRYFFDKVVLQGVKA